MEAWAVARQSSTALTCGRHEISDLHGSGGGPTGGTRAYGGSALGGLIRSWEIQAGEIRHALAVSLANDQLYSASNNTGWVWPATEQDANAAWTYTGSIPMGSYFAIPPSVDVEAQPLTAAGKAVARALQRYGAYVVDRSTGFAMFAEVGSPLAWVNDARSDLADHPRPVPHRHEQLRQHPQRGRLDGRRLQPARPAGRPPGRQRGGRDDRMQGVQHRGNHRQRHHHGGVPQRQGVGHQRLLPRHDRDAPQRTPTRPSSSATRSARASTAVMDGRHRFMASVIAGAQSILWCALEVLD
jgi:hypothetical protein